MDVKIDCLKTLRLRQWYVERWSGWGRSGTAKAGDASVSRRCWRPPPGCRCHQNVCTGKWSKL